MLMLSVRKCEGVKVKGLIIISRSIIYLSSEILTYFVPVSAHNRHQVYGQCNAFLLTLNFLIPLFQEISLDNLSDSELYDAIAL